MSNPIPELPARRRRAALSCLSMTFLTPEKTAGRCEDGLVRMGAGTGGKGCIDAIAGPRGMACVIDMSKRRRGTRMKRRRRTTFRYARGTQAM
jgi:hypothetical protein